MNRLTRRTEDGKAMILLYSDPNDLKSIGEEIAAKNIKVIEKLARYEDLEEPDPETGLKPCPFCRSKWTQVKYSNNPFDTKEVYGGFHAYCDDCHCTTMRFPTPEEAIEAWNRRAT